MSLDNTANTTKALTAKAFPKWRDEVDPEAILGLMIMSRSCHLIQVGGFELLVVTKEAVILDGGYLSRC